MCDRTVAVGKDKMTHLPRMYGLRDRTHMEAREATKELEPQSAFVCQLSSINDLLPLPLWSPGRYWNSYNSSTHHMRTHLGASFSIFNHLLGNLQEKATKYDSECV